MGYILTGYDGRTGTLLTYDHLVSGDGALLAITSCK